jgi:hypothetical protein
MKKDKMSSPYQHHNISRLEEKHRLICRYFGAQEILNLNPEYRNSGIVI